MARRCLRRRRLWDAYCFPGFRPEPTVRGIFGDPQARVITLHRRSKKPRAAVLQRLGVGAKAIGKSKTRHRISPYPRRTLGYMSTRLNATESNGGLFVMLKLSRWCRCFLQLDATYRNEVQFSANPYGCDFGSPKIPRTVGSGRKPRKQ